MARRQKDPRGRGKKNGSKEPLLTEAGVDTAIEELELEYEFEPTESDGDMFGGTPSNLAISCMSRPKVEVLAGINLPMLVKLAKVRDERPLPDAIAMAQEAGRKYVTIASRVLAGK